MVVQSEKTVNLGNSLQASHGQYNGQHWVKLNFANAVVVNNQMSTSVYNHVIKQVVTNANTFGQLFTMIAHQKCYEVQRDDNSRAWSSDGVTSCNLPAGGLSLSYLKISLKDNVRQPMFQSDTFSTVIRVF